jgi:hypothetical protein
MNNLTLIPGGRPVQFNYTAVVGAGVATTPKFTFAAGAPAALVDWGDGTAYSAVTSTVELSHTYANAGSYKVRLLMPAQQKWVTQIDINTDYVQGSFQSMGISRLRSLSSLLLSAGSNAVSGPNTSLPRALTIMACGGGTNALTGNTSQLPRSLTTLYCYGGANAVVGNLSDLPPGMTYLSCYSANTITGSLSDLPATMQTIYLYGGSNVITAGTPPPLTRSFPGCC